MAPRPDLTVSTAWRAKAAAILAPILVLGVLHWTTPTHDYPLRAVHILLRQLFAVPIVLAAIWFGARGVLVSGLVITAIYVPHILLQWSHDLGENVTQAGEVALIWLIGLVASTFVRRERSALEEVAQTHEGSLIALVAALDAREHNTQLHSLRVRAYALRIGRVMQMTPGQLRILAQAALLHDVGKIGTPDQILLKPGSLTDQEWQTMKLHPEIGRRILLAVPFLKDVAEVVYSHHEKFDGTGYPRGLTGQKIPLEARVFAVADVFDALTSDRPYHAKVSCEQARELIGKDSGTHFDPAVVGAFREIPCGDWIELEKHVAGEAAKDK